MVHPSFPSHRPLTPKFSPPSPACLWLTLAPIQMLSARVRHLLYQRTWLHIHSRWHATYMHAYMTRAWARALTSRTQPLLPLCVTYGVKRGKTKLSLDVFNFLRGAPCLRDLLHPHLTHALMHMTASFWRPVTLSLFSWEINKERERESQAREQESVNVWRGGKRVGERRRSSSQNEGNKQISKCWFVDLCLFLPHLD